MYKYKKVNIKTLRDKTIRGAQEFLESGHINAENILYQVGSNDLEECEPTEVVKNMEKLIIDTQRQIPGSNIIISSILPCFYRNQMHRREYETKRIKCNKQLSNLCDQYGLKYVSHNNLRQIHFEDGIHLSKDGGISLYVRNLKNVLNPLLGVKNDHRNEQKFHQTGNNRRENFSSSRNYSQNQSHYGNESVFEGFNNRGFDGSKWPADNNPYYGGYEQTTNHDNNRSWNNDQFYYNNNNMYNQNKGINMRLLRLALGL